MKPLLRGGVGHRRRVVAVLAAALVLPLAAAGPAAAAPPAQPARPAPAGSGLSAALAQAVGGVLVA